MASLATQSNSNTSLAVTVNTSFASPPQQDNLLIAVVTASVGTGSISLSNSGWSTGASIAVGVAGGMVVFYKVSDGSGSDQTITANATLAAFMDIQIFEYGQITNESPLDKTASTADSGSGVTSRASGTTATLTQGNEIAFVAVATAGANGGSPSWTNSFNTELTTSHLITGDIQVTATTALSSTASWTTSQRAAGIILTFFGEVGDSYGVKFGIKPPNPTINWDNPLTKGLIFDSTFTDKGGLAPKDNVTNNTSSTLTLGTGGFIKDLYGSALSFDNANTNLFWNTHSNQDNLTIYSFEMMFLRLGNGVNTTMRYFSKSNGTAPGYIECQDDGTSLSLNIQAATVNGALNFTPLPSNNIWHHMVWTQNEASQPGSLYLDGLLKTLSSNTNSSGARQAESAHLYIGNRSGGGRTFNGYILYLRQYNRILNIQEVKQLASNPWQIYKQSGLITR